MSEPKKLERSSAWADIGLAGRILVRAMINPLVNLAFVGTLAGAISVAPATGVMYLVLGLFAPWLFMGLFLLNLPLLGAARKWFRLPRATRRNHALEHGTIVVLRETYGRARKLSGRSSEQGFRVAGAKNQKDIMAAFATAATRIESGDHGFVVARGCGSMIVTAQAAGLALFSATGVVFFLTETPPSVVLMLILGEYAVVVLLRYPLGMYLQRKRFLSFDFHKARIASIIPVEKAELFERHPVFFVRTQVTAVAPE